MIARPWTLSVVLGFTKTSSFHGSELTIRIGRRRTSEHTWMITWSAHSPSCIMYWTYWHPVAVRHCTLRYSCGSSSKNSWYSERFFFNVLHAISLRLLYVNLRFHKVFKPFCHTTLIQSLNFRHRKHSLFFPICSSINTTEWKKQLPSACASFQTRSPCLRMFSTNWWCMLLSPPGPIEKLTPCDLSSFVALCVSFLLRFSDVFEYSNFSWLSSIGFVVYLWIEVSYHVRKKIFAFLLVKPARVVVFAEFDQVLCASVSPRSPADNALRLLQRVVTWDLLSDCSLTVCSFCCAHF